MKRPIFLSVICLFCAIMNLYPAYAEKVVQSEGTASVHKGFVDIARDRAIADAQRRAVEQAVGVMISNETLVENFEIISDKILSQSKGYIQSYEVLSEEREGDLYKVMIEAKVSTARMENDLEAINLLIARKAKPRLMILFNGSEQSDFIGEARMTRYFLSKGFKLVDSEMVRKNLEHGSYERLTDDVVTAQRVGQRFGAEVIILCSVETTSNPFKIGEIEMHSNSATVSGKAIDVGTRNIITTGSETKRLPGIKDYIQPSTEQASEMLAKALMNDILSQWSKELTNTLEVRLFVSGFQSYNELNVFKHLLEAEVRGVEEIRQRLYSQGRAELEIDLRGDTVNFASDLASRHVNGRSIEIREITQNRVEIKLLP